MLSSTLLFQIDQQANAALRENSAEELRAVQDFVIHLDRSLAVLPAVQIAVRLFRGINVPVDPVCVPLCFGGSPSFAQRDIGPRQIRRCPRLAMTSLGQADCGRPLIFGAAKSETLATVFTSIQFTTLVKLCHL